MDFFEHQERARRRTGRLVLLFVMAAAFLVAGLYLIARGVMICILGPGPDAPPAPAGSGAPHAAASWAPSWWWDPETFWWVTLVTLSIVLLGSICKVVQLRAGGAALAASLGGRLLTRSTKEPAERRILNVVDEMAVASGIAAPAVYLLDREPGINAFAAGLTPEDAVIGVTAGCVELLSRQELQGVIAHEFSHVLNGDMRLNVQLLGLLHGILVLGLAGRTLLRGTFSRRRSLPWLLRRHGKATVVLFVIGLAAMTIGYMGVFFGTLIKAAVSRQREFLADASAVQFTRSPAGITGALRKIGGLAEGSAMLDPRSMTINHMFFSQGFFGGLDGLFATHPPLVQRIRRIEPRFDGRFPIVKRPAARSPTGPGAVPAPAPVTPKPSRKAQPVPTRSLPDPIVLIGNPDAEHLEYARALLERLPDAIREAASDPYGARALVYALLLDGRPDVRRRQLARLEAHADRTVCREAGRMHLAASEIDPAARLPLLDLAIPTLGQLSPSQYRVFEHNVTALVQADGEVELFEFMLRRVLLRHLEPTFRTVKKPVVQYYSLKRLAEPCSVLLSALAYRGHPDVDQASRLFAGAAPYLETEGLALLPRERCALAALDRALEILVQCSPRETRKIMRACTACLLADQTITVDEAELLRAVADAFGCPMPPLLAGRTVPPFDGSRPAHRPQGGLRAGLISPRSSATAPPR